MIVKAINKSNYTLHYIVFNRKIHQKSHLKIRSSSNTIRKLYFFFNWLPIKISWQMRDFNAQLESWKNTEQLPSTPLLSKLLFWTSGEKTKAKQTSAFWTVNPIRNKAGEKMWVGVIQGRACTACLLRFWKTLWWQIFILPWILPSTSSPPHPLCWPQAHQILPGVCTCC